jgi:hypothetical protein
LTKRLAISIGLVLALVALSGAPALAGDGNKMSLGYAYLKSLEDGGGSIPLGVFLSFAPRSGSGFELDAAYHRDKDGNDTLNLFTGALGPRFGLGSEDSSPWIHVLGAVRHARFEGDSETKFGGFAGGGIDLPTGGSLMIRVGADFQMFFIDGGTDKSLRLTAGFTF